MSSPARSRPEPFDLAVVALSARALAASAQRAGLRALAIDLFADADTREFAERAVRAAPHRRGPGFDRRSLIAALATHAPEGLPVVLGAGFEHAPGLMRAIAARNPIFGASPDQVTRLKEPFGFEALLSDLDIPHPRVSRDAATAGLHLSPLGDQCEDGRLGSSSAQRGRGTMRSMVEGATLPQEPQGPTERPTPCPLHRFAVPLPHAAHGGGSRGGASSEPAETWLSKRAGASGGAHVRRGGAAGRRRYLQAFVDGRAVSALFLADGRSIRIIGFSEQWTDPAKNAPFRYGGAVGPIDLPAPLAEAIASALGRIVAATGLAGLASADMIVPESEGAQSFRLLEINPRPGATLDVFDHDETPSLLGLHLDACAGRLPGPLPAPEKSRAAAIVHAEHPVEIATLRRPLWTADWPSCDETVPAGAPVCTVLAVAATPSAARALVMERRAALLASFRAASKAPKITNTNAMVPA